MAAKVGFMTRLFGDTAAPDAGTTRHAVPMLAQYLPYRSFKAANKIFYNAESLGFAM